MFITQRHSGPYYDGDDDESMKLMFAHSYSLKNSQECANEDMLQQTVFSSCRNEDDGWQLRSGAGSEFHVDGPATAKLRGP